MTATRTLVEGEGAKLEFPGRGVVIRNFGLSVRAGARIALVGPSGSGKSSLLRMLAGDVQPTSGTIRRSIEPTSVSIIYQSNPVLARRSVSDNVLVGCRGRLDQDNDIETILARVGLDGKQNQRAGTLSGGEMQRLCIARVVAQSPALLLADEPTGQLDRESSVSIAQLIAGLDERIAVVVATHDATVGDALDIRWRIGDEGTVLSE